MSQKTPPHELLGGQEGISSLLYDLYRRLFSDPLVGFLFEGQDLDRIVSMQTKFTARMLGDNTVVYPGKSMPEAHDQHPILPGHFDRRHRLLQMVLDEHRVPEEAKVAWLALDQALRPAILKAGQVRIEELRWRDDS
ncbi:MAG: group 1 truncated hemoglobin [Polyangiaceae bacterium]